MSHASPYKVTALVSLYNAERFIRGCLEDLLGQSIFAQTEIIIIDACSPQNERSIIEEYTKKYDNILYYRTAQRETLYASWNRALHMARGSYITNANADDRHAPHALETLATALDLNPHVALAYANCRVTAQENATFDAAPLLGRLVQPAYSHVRLMYACLAGPQPMWRRSVHEEVGYFDESFTIAGDYDMWLRMSQRYPFLHIPKMLGLFLSYEHNLAKSNARALLQEEEKLHEQAVLHFLRDDVMPRKEAEEQFTANEKSLQLVVQKQKQGKNISLQDLEFPFYAKALLLAKLGHKSSALEILQPFLAHGDKAHKLCHLHFCLKSLHT